MSKALSLRDQLAALERQQQDALSRRATLAEITGKALPDFDAQRSARIVAKAGIDDQLHGTQTATAVAAEQAKLSKAFDQATRDRHQAQTELDQIDVTCEVLREEIQRITKELAGIAKEKALQEFLKARDKLAQMAVTLRKQVIECGAWAELSDQRERVGDILIPKFSAEKTPEHFTDDIRVWKERASDIQEAIYRRAEVISIELEDAP